MHLSELNFGQQCKLATRPRRRSTTNLLIRTTSNLLAPSATQIHKFRVTRVTDDTVTLDLHLCLLSRRHEPPVSVATLAGPSQLVDLHNDTSPLDSLCVCPPSIVSASLTERVTSKLKRPDAKWNGGPGGRYHKCESDGHERAGTVLLMPMLR